MAISWHYGHWNAYGANPSIELQYYLIGDPLNDFTGATGASANGYEIDLGIQGKPKSWLSLGANLQNALPAAMGGKLTFADGWEESYPLWVQRHYRCGHGPDCSF